MVGFVESDHTFKEVWYNQLNVLHKSVLVLSRGAGVVKTPGSLDAVASAFMRVLERIGGENMVETCYRSIIAVRGQWYQGLQRPLFKQL